MQAGGYRAWNPKGTQMRINWIYRNGQTRDLKEMGTTVQVRLLMLVTKSILTFAKILKL